MSVNDSSNDWVIHRIPYSCDTQNNTDDIWFHIQYICTEIHKPIPFSEPEGLKEIKQDDNERIEKIKEQPDNDIEQQSMGTTKNSEETKDNDSKEKIKESHFINLK